MSKSAARHGATRAGCALLCSTLFLWGCAGTPDQDTGPTPTPTPQPIATTDSGIDLTLPPSQYQAEFASAEQALANFDWMSAAVALEPLDEQALSLDLTPDRRLARADAGAVRKSIEESGYYLQMPPKVDG